MLQIPLINQARYIWISYLKNRWSIYLVGLAMVILTDFMQVVVARTLGWILDFFDQQSAPFFLEGRERREVFLGLFLLLFGSRLLLFLARMGWRMTLARETHWAASKLKSDIWHNVCFFKKEDLANKYTKGVLMNAMTSDVNSGRFIFGFTLVALFDVVFLGFFTLGTMLTIHIPLTLWSLGILLILPYFIKRLSELEIDRYRKAQEYLGVFNDLGSQVVSTIRLQRLTQTGVFWKKRLMLSAEEYRRKRLDAVEASLFYIPTMGLSSVVSYIVLFSIGVNYVLQGALSLGDFVAMQGLIFLLQDPLSELGFIISEWRKSFASLERLATIYNQEKEGFLLTSGEDIESTDLVLEACNLSFQYSDGETPVFKGVDINIERGDRLGISGPVGAGKSTLLNILSGLERKVEGSLKFHGKKFDQYQHESLRNYIGFVGQKAFLFADTIRENVRLDQSLSDDEVWHFLRLAGLEKDILNFSDQLDTPLGEWGINLSGGQKQRLTLARALARRPSILFLDDCLSAIDTVTEERILSNIDRELKETTIVWVAHRKSTLKYCHHIMEL